MQPVLPYEGHYDTLFTISQPFLQFLDGLTVVAKSVGWLGLLAVNLAIHRQERSGRAAGSQGRMHRPSAFPPMRFGGHLGQEPRTTISHRVNQGPRVSQTSERPSTTPLGRLGGGRLRVLTPADLHYDSCPLNPNEVTLLGQRPHLALPAHPCYTNVVSDTSWCSRQVTVIPAPPVHDGARQISVDFGA